MACVRMFTDVGLKQSVVQSTRGSEPIFLNTAWTIQIIRGIVLCCFALLMAGVIATVALFELMPRGSVYNDPRLPIVIAVASFSAIVEGCNSTKLFEAYRNLMLKHITLIEIISQIGGVLWTFGWLAIDRSIWALVSGGMFRDVLLMVLSHSLLPGTRNHWKLDKSAAWEMSRFGKWILVSSVLGFVVSNGDRMLLGGMVNSEVLGIYVIALNVFSAVEGVLSRINSSVIFPALSETVRERPKQVSGNFYRFHAVMASIAYFSAGFLFVFGQTLISLLYDPRYHNAGTMLEVLSVALITIPFQISLQYFVAIGMPFVFTSAVGIRLITLVVAMVFGFRMFGLYGALWGFVASYFGSLPFVVAYSFRFSLFNWRRELLVLPVIILGLAFGKLFAYFVGR